MAVREIAAAYRVIGRCQHPVRDNLTPDRAAGLQGTLTNWLELDREERRG